MGCFIHPSSHTPNKDHYIQMKFLVLNSDQDGDGFEIQADTREEALEKAMAEIGWYVIQDDEEDEEELE